MKQSVLVIGLGRFGTAAARELMALGHDVLAVDRDEARVNEIAPDVTPAVQADASDADALRALGRGGLRARDRGDQRRRRSRASSRRWPCKQPRRRERRREGGDRAPRRDPRAGRRDAGRLPRARDGRAGRPRFASPHVLDYLDVAPGFGIVRFPRRTAGSGRTLGELDLAGRGLDRDRPAARRPSSPSAPAPRRQLESGDELILIGRDERLDPARDGSSAGAGQPTNSRPTGRAPAAASTTTYAANSSSPAYRWSLMFTPMIAIRP